MIKRFLLLPMLLLSVFPVMAAVESARSGVPLAAPNSVTEDVQQAETAIKNRQYKNAEAILRSIIQRDPKNARAHLRLGNMIERRVAIRHPKAALEAYQQAVALDPTDPEGYLALARFLPSNRDNEPSEVIQLYRQAIKVARPNAEIYYSLGVELSDRYGRRVITAAQKDEAIAAFRKAIELDPQQGKFYVILGAQLWERGEGDAGNAVLQAGMKLNDAGAYGMYSAVLSHQNRLSEMVPIYQQAIQKHPNDPNILELYSNFGQVLEELKRFQEAEALYRQITVINPASNLNFAGKSHTFNGHLLRITGDLDMAATALGWAIAAHPDFAYPHEELGQVLQQQGKLKEAAAAYRQARSLSRDPAYLQDELSQVEALLRAKP
jgi:superkiller protein 3